ncbi:MAG: ABC-2 family transporter protein [Planctomycetaceae bacterium]
MSFLVGFLLEALIGMIAFWFLEVSSLLFIYMMLNYFLSGHMLPLDLFPPAVNAAIEYLPFKFLAYVPPAIFLGRYDNAQLVQELLLEAGWIVLLLIANRVAFARGVRRYAAFGG